MLLCSILPLDVICNRIQADVMATLKDDADTKTILAEAGLVSLRSNSAQAVENALPDYESINASTSNGNYNGNGAPVPVSASAGPSGPGMNVRISPR